MFYIYTLLIPFLITIITIFILKKYFRLIDLLLVVCGIMYLYSIGIYSLEYNNLIDQGWVTYSLFFFLLPISIILSIIKLFITIKNYINGKL